MLESALWLSVWCSLFANSTSSCVSAILFVFYDTYLCFELLRQQFDFLEQVSRFGKGFLIAVRYLLLTCTMTALPTFSMSSSLVNVY